MDSKQVLKVTVKAFGSFKGYQNFFAQMTKDGRITIPEISIELLKPETEDRLEHFIMEVILEPV